MKEKKLNPEKSAKLEAKGDKLLAKGKFKKALKKFKEAMEFNPNRVELYDKLVQTRDGLDEDWKMDDFVESVNWMMKKQEIETPQIKHVYAQLSPEWNEARMVAISLLEATEDEIPRIIEKMVSLGEIGTRAAASVLTDFRKIAKSNSEESTEEKQQTPE
ncbi:MAG TPA: hypothetical protein PKU96_05470 [bacterium]|jgi:tetratricopeptide (TPR) repeat protein|nr:hypothetical protein [Myxococcales bacterium]HPW45801.1 hypothetical protein [bacterium]HQC50784.1 hypothetical protein [bacterium]HQG13415.1 hypothetical protein [bacterium]HQH80302.1 hypothetical protein [bacterium]